jgi:hypothetical protein
MDESFDPVLQLKTLLGPKPSHPWAALIPQVILWCFRRFCVKHLIEEYDEPLTDQLWDDHIDLIRQHAPIGLEAASSFWLSPENIEHMHSSLQDYNRFFIDFIVVIDDVMKDDDAEMEHIITTFFDVDIQRVIEEWLEEEYRPFLIFPLDDAKDDEFTDEQYEQLIGALTQYSLNNTYVEPEAEPEPEPEAEPEPEPEPEPEQQIEPFPLPPPPPRYERHAPPAPIVTFAEAVSRRKTLRSRLCKATRGKTRKLIPQDKQREND